MNRFKVTHPWKATGDTLLMVYDTCPGTKIFTFKLPGGCGEQTEEGRLVRCWPVAAKILFYLLTLIS